MGNFVLRRKGEFDFYPSVSENQCKVKGHRHYKYRVKVTAIDRLDSSGFVIEHQVIDEMIQLEIRKADSCERLAKQITYGLIDLLSNEGVHIVSISVRIIPVGSDVKANIEFIV